jgi:hypothetical protein
MVATFTDINDAMGQIGGMLQSPAANSLNQLKSYSTAFNESANINKTAFSQLMTSGGYTQGVADGYVSILHNIDSFSQDLTTCGSDAQSILDASLTDYIKNTGIQEAGRELRKTIGDTSFGTGPIDCISGFATLFESKGIFDDALGLTDLAQMQNRIENIISDATNPSKLANMVVNLDAIQGLLDAGQGMCDIINGGLGDLIGRDLAALTASLNKLAQWAALTKLATSDPCSLVTNNMLLQHITSPVMEDIVDLYTAVTSSVADPLGTALNIFVPEGIPGAGLIGALEQAAGTGLQSFESYFSTSGITDVLGDASSFKDGLLMGENVLNDSLAQFTDMKNMVEFDSAMKNISSLSIDGFPDLNTESLTKFMDPLADTATTAFNELSGSFESVTSLFGGTAGGLPDPLGSAPAALSAPAPLAVTKVRSALGAVSDNVDTLVASAEGAAVDVSKAGKAALDKVVADSFAPYISDATAAAANLGKEGAGAVQQVLKTANLNFDFVGDALKQAQSSGNWSAISIGSCYGASALGTSSFAGCKAAGGIWKVQTGTSLSRLAKTNIASVGRTISKRAVTIESRLPTNKPFDLAKLLV